MTNDDKELLVLAAKAIGCTLRQSAFDRKTLILIEAGNERRVWSPLEDDGDAFRLAVALRIHVAPTPAYIEARYFDGGAWQCFREVVISMPATRRAIVRAAAKIGRGMA